MTSTNIATETDAPDGTWSWRLRLAACMVIAILLVAIGDQYPFSPFPMYSKLDSSADVLYVADQNGKPLALGKLFNVGSAQAKKRFEKELLLLAQTRDYEKAKPEQVHAAAVKFLETLWKDRREHRTVKLDLTQLKAQIITISMDQNEQFQRAEQTLGSISLKP